MVSVTAEPWKKAVKDQIMSTEMFSLCVAKLPEAQRYVEIRLLGDWAPVFGGVTSSDSDIKLVGGDTAHMCKPQCLNQSYVLIP